ncbi:hypothetical protein C5167_018735 [Papaver somniferum]|uniref:Uncharacterized protein n=1 Tax=Papaver somniferum TaxID=3469 RepID=A0A4Y7INQ2_PAPSO|nr:hypothetical protein C5167_018735 [Papaver somniferum]
MKIFFLKSDGNGQLQLIERDDMEDEGCSFEAIEKLIAQGINAGDIKKLQDAGLCNWNQFMMRAKKDFTGVKGLSEDKVDKIFDSVCEAAEKLAKEEIVKITSGSSVLDEHLGVIAQGINAGDIKKLQDAGVHTVPETAENIVKKEIVKLTSGSSALDELLGDLYIETKERLQEEAEKRAKEKKEIEELVAQILSAQVAAATLVPVPTEDEEEEKWERSDYVKL